MSDEIPSSQLSIIVDLISSSFDFKALCNNLSSRPSPNCDHHYWHFGGLRSYTISYQSNIDETTINNDISELKLLQNQTSIFPPYWISYKKYEQEKDETSPEVIQKNLKLGRFYTNNTFQIEYTAGALVQLNKYIYDIQTEIKDGCRLVFYHDRIDLDYGGKENKLRKTFKAEMMDKCVIIMKEEKSFTLFIYMTGNPIEYKGLNDDERINLQQDSSLQKSTEPTVSYKRTAPREQQPFYSTIRLVISLSNDNLNEENSGEHNQRLSYCYKQFQDFFLRNHINECFGIIRSISSRKNISSIISLFMTDERMSFIKQYCWQMLLSIGYRFQQRLTEGFIQNLNLIEDDDEFYQTSLHIWRRSSEYYFIDLLGELHRYQEKIDAVASLTTNNQQQSFKKEESEQERWSIHTPPRHYAYVPSVTLTPTTICVKPLKLVKTNRVLREPKFGGKLMFALVDVKDENRMIDLFPHDCMLKKKTLYLKFYMNFSFRSCSTLEN
jgi:hypothetical protein